MATFPSVSNHEREDATTNEKKKKSEKPWPYTYIYIYVYVKFTEVNMISEPDADNFLVRV